MAESLPGNNLRNTGKNCRFLLEPGLHAKSTIRQRPIVPAHAACPGFLQAIFANDRRKRRWRVQNRPFP